MSTGGERKEREGNIFAAAKTKLISLKKNVMTAYDKWIIIYHIFLYVLVFFAPKYIVTSLSRKLFSYVPRQHRIRMERSAKYSCLSARRNINLLEYVTFA